ncbi:MAG: DUF1987 domain-containing protein [Bacteroidota bacterium]|nr:DUF1987 domain-containing protein [Bacteroidota bacterium]
MKKLLISKTKRTPEIIFTTSGDLSIIGSSLPEDAKNFYEPILFWLEEFKQTFPKKISLTIDLEYISTSSTLIILDILKTVNNPINCEVNIVWVYEEEDIDMKEHGEILQSSIKRNFEFVKKQIN